MKQGTNERRRPSSSSDSGEEVGKLRLSSSSDSGEEDEDVGMFFVVSIDHERSPFYCIYELDLYSVPRDSDRYLQLEDPVAIFSAKKYPVGMRFISLGLNIYMMGGQSKRTMDPSADVYFYDTTCFYSTSGEPQKFPIQLSAGKVSPILIAHQRRKIYVLAGSFNPRLNPSPLFEVLDVDSISVTALSAPAFPVGITDDSERDVYAVEAHAVHESTIFVSTPLGIYSFDVNQKPPGLWTHLAVFKGVQRFPFVDQALFFRGLWLAFPSKKDMNLGNVRAYDLNEDNGLVNSQPVFGLPFKESAVDYLTCARLIHLWHGKLCFIRTGFEFPCLGPLGYPNGTLSALDVLKVKDKNKKIDNLLVVNCGGFGFIMPDSRRNKLKGLTHTCLVTRGRVRQSSPEILETIF